MLMGMTKSTISLLLKFLIFFWYYLLVYPCQVLLMILNKDEYVKGEDKTNVKGGNEGKRVIKINGTKIYHILYNNQGKGDGKG